MSSGACAQRNDETTADWIRYGGILIFIYCMLLCFQGMTHICEEQFVPALEVLCKKWKIPPNVAGATIMAIGTSAPDVFVCVFGLFVTNSSVGIGTVVGSVVFNHLVICAACVMCSDNGIKLDPVVLTREASAYLLSLFLLVIALSDDIRDHDTFNPERWKDCLHVTHFDALGMVLWYCVYVFVAFAFTKENKEYILSIFANKIKSDSQDMKQDQNKNDGSSKQKEELEIPDTDNQDYQEYNNRDHKSVEHAIELGVISELKPIEVQKTRPTYNPLFEEILGPNHQSIDLGTIPPMYNPMLDEMMGPGHVSIDLGTNATNNFYPSTMVIPDNSHSTSSDKVKLPAAIEVSTAAPTHGHSSSQQADKPVSGSNWFATMSAGYNNAAYPVTYLIDATTPTCKSPETEVKYLQSIVVCVIWLGILSEGIVACLQVLGDLLGASQALMGLTVSSIGASLPSIWSSMIVARRGEGDMAISNALGSNTFSILGGLGIPWLLYTIIHGHSYSGIQDGGIVMLIILLIAILIIFYVMVLVNNWSLKYWMGPIFLSTYVGVIIICCYTQLVAVDKAN